MSYTRDLRYYATEKIDPYDLSFYYLNAKYFKELGYFDLYPFLLRVSYDNNLAPFKFRSDKVLLQNHEGYYWKQYQEVMSDEAAYTKIRERFSEPRYTQFLSDVAYLTSPDRQGWHPKRWTNFFWDHGFNASPAWLGLATPLFHWIPVTSLKAVCLFDAALLAAAIVTVGYFYGAVIACILVSLLAISLSTEWPPIGAVVGRYDFLAFLIWSVVLAHRKKFTGAGVCFGIASAFRYLPLAVLPFLAMQLVYRRFSSNERSPDVMHFMKGLAAAFFTLHLLAEINLGAGTITEYYHKIQNHTATENLTRGKVGLTLALSWNGDMHQARIDEERKELIRNRAPLIRIAAVLLTVGLLAFALFEPLHAVLGLFPFMMFLWAMPSYHYFVLLLLPLLVGYIERQKRYWFFLFFSLLSVEVLVRIIRNTMYEASVTTTSLWCIMITVVIAALTLCKKFSCCSSSSSTAS